MGFKFMPCLSSRKYHHHHHHHVMTRWAFQQLQYTPFVKWIDNKMSAVLSDLFRDVNTKPGTQSRVGTEHTLGFQSYDHADKKLIHQVDLHANAHTSELSSSLTHRHFVPAPVSMFKRYLQLCRALLQPAADLWSPHTNAHTPIFQWALQHQSFQIPGCWHKGSGEAERGECGKFHK